MNDQIEFLKKRKTPLEKKNHHILLFDTQKQLLSIYQFYVVLRGIINIQCKMGILMQCRALKPLGGSGDGVTDGVRLWHMV